MKKRILSLLLVLLMVVTLVPVSALAEDDVVAYEVTGGNIYFDKSTGTIAYSDDTVTEAVIPSEIVGVTVTSIDDCAFYGCKILSRVVIPNSVTDIYYLSFSDCASLTNIEVEGGNEYYSSVGGVLFNKDKTELIKYPEGKTDASYTVPNSVTSIRLTAFRDCMSLTSITLSNSLTSIGESAFDSCKSLKNIRIPNSLTEIGEAAFIDCENLTSITIPNSVTSIAWYAFWGCTSLTDVYYSGNEAEWNEISIEENNEPLLNAKIHYNSGAPVDPVDPVTPSGFVDVPSDAFYAKAVKWAVENEITTGVGNNRFDPNGQCTRGQVVTFLWRAAGMPSVSANVSFTDVKAGEYYYEAVKWAVANGVTTGVGGNRFAPNDTCTRGQVVTFLHRAENSPSSSTASSFSDVQSADFYYNAVNWAVENGITSGVGNNRFAPNDTCTRGQVVTFLYRAQ